MFVYLDNSATTRPYDEVTERMVRMMKEDFGNPSSLHRMGITAEKAMKAARREVALSLCAQEDEIYFTGGGTEGANTAIFGAAAAKKRQGRKIITTAVEHPAVLEACKKLEKEGFEVVYLKPDRTGRISPEAVTDAIDQNTILITIMHVNNELGSIQPLKEIGQAKAAAEKQLGNKILFHTDAVQSYGKISVDPASINADLLTVSGHKVHGPKGVGAIFVSRNSRIEPFLYGGGQEKGLRSGTENVPAITGFGEAAGIIRKEGEKRRNAMTEVRRYLLEGIASEIPEIAVNSPEESLCAPSLLSISFLGCKAEVLLHKLEQNEIYVSTGSACSSKKKGSHVLAAAGLSAAEIEGAIRFSLSAENTKEEMDYVVAHLKEAVSSMRRLKSAFGKNKG